MQDSATSMFESRSSSAGVNTKVEGSLSLFSGLSTEVSGGVSTSDNQNSETSSTASESTSSSQDSSRSEQSFTMDDILVEGGHQRVAAILSDRNRAGFKSEFQDWLDSIPEYPKGYDFKFGEISDLLDINFRSLANDGFAPCWDIPNKELKTDNDGNSVWTYIVKTKDDNGDQKEEVRECRFDSIDDFQDKMNKRRLSLKHAITLFAKNRGRSWSELTLPAGSESCEQKTSGTDQISYDDLTNESVYELSFDLLLPIGNKIQKDETLLLRFIKSNEDGTSGRWQVNGAFSKNAGQIGKSITTIDDKVYVLGVRFTYESDSTGNYLKWTKTDCEYNVRRFKNLQGIECDLNADDTNGESNDDSEDGDIDWVGVPLATIVSLAPVEEYLPCNMDWTNHQMLMSDQSCVRFTASSTGPIYFGLSAIPDKLSTWYYFRITSVN